MKTCLILFGLMGFLFCGCDQPSPAPTSAPASTFAPTPTYAPAGLDDHRFDDLLVTEAPVSPKIHSTVLAPATSAPSPAPPASAPAPAPPASEASPEDEVPPPRETNLPREPKRAAVQTNRDVPPDWSGLLMYSEYDCRPCDRAWARLRLFPAAHDSTQPGFDCQIKEIKLNGSEADLNRQFAERKLTGTPTFLFFQKGREVGPRVLGFSDTQEEIDRLTQRLKVVLGNAAKPMSSFPPSQLAPPDSSPVPLGYATAGGGCGAPTTFYSSPPTNYGAPAVYGVAVGNCGSPPMYSMDTANCGAPMMYSSPPVFSSPGCGSPAAYSASDYSLQGGYSVRGPDFGYAVGAGAVPYRGGYCVGGVCY